MKSLTTIIPLHKIDENIEKYLSNALSSLKNVKDGGKTKVMFVGPKRVIERAEEIFLNLKCPQSATLLVNDNTDVFEQINKAVYACTTKYFSVLEFDDAFSPIWFKSVDEYLNAGEKYSIYLPLIKTYTEDDKYLGLVNEVAWARGFSDKLGFVQLNSLEVFMDFNVTGAIINTEDFISVGGLKPSLKIASWYEFLLRMAKNENTIFVVPKVGYGHILGRKDSYLETEQKTISPEEGKKLIDLARTEYFFDYDRGNTTTEEEGEKT